MTELAQPFCAKYSSSVMDAIVGLLAPLDAQSVLDPNAGVGGIHELREHGYRTTGIEIEPEFAIQHPDTIIGDATNIWLEKDNEDGYQYWWCGNRLLCTVEEPFDAIVVSPTYANRFADQYIPPADSKWTYRSYAVSLGRKLTDGNSGKLQWGQEYRDLYEEMWASVSKVAGKYWILNVSDHIRKGEVIPVTQFHIRTLVDLGWMPVQSVKIETPRMRHGANGNLRVDNEFVVLFER